MNQTTSCTSDLLKAHMRASTIGTEMQHQEVQLRLVSVLFAGMMCFHFIDPAVFILNVPSSIIARVALMTHESVLLAWIFLVCAMLVVPFMVMSAFRPRSAVRRACTKLACLGLAVAGLIWFLLAWTSKNTEFPYVVTVYMRTGLGSLGFALVLALSLNNELARTLLDT